jgi:hypothetical protein
MMDGLWGCDNRDLTDVGFSCKDAPAHLLPNRGVLAVVMEVCGGAAERQDASFTAHRDNRTRAAQSSWTGDAEVPH